MEGKVAIITGAGQGIGKAIAVSLAKKGVSAAIVDMNIANAEKTACEIVEAGERAISIQADISRVEDVKKVVDLTIKGLGSPDILVNNAGILHKTHIEDITEEEWDRIMAVNLKSVFFAIQQVLPHMKAKKYGRIINISSLAGRMGGFANGVAYSASKAGVIGLTMAVARRVAEFDITVNAVAPGTIETDIIKQLTDESIEMLKKTIPLKRFGKPENVAETVAFLASDKADFITGAVIDINGGIFMG